VGKIGEQCEKDRRGVAQIGHLKNPKKRNAARKVGSPKRDNEGKE